MPTRTKPVLRLHFCDFWGDFDPLDNFFVHLLSPRWTIELSETPDFVIYSCFGHEFRRFDCVRILVVWENRPWSFAECDYAISGEYLTSDRHLRLPLYVSSLPIPFVQPVVDARAALAGKVGFCSQVVSSGDGTTRNRLAAEIGAYQPIASGGRYMNNVGGPVLDKLAFVGRYKFHLACENSSYPGYTTEKLVHGLQADSIPIYWGNPDVGRDFDVARFINVHDHPTERSLLDRIRELDQDDDAWCEMVARPWFPGGVPPQCADPEFLRDSLARFFSSTALERPDSPSLVRRGLDRWSAHRRRVSHRS